MPEMSTYEAARVFNANPVTLQRLAAVGKLDVRKDENGHWRFSKTSLEKWNRNRRMRKRTKHQGLPNLSQESSVTQRTGN